MRSSSDQPKGDRIPVPARQSGITPKARRTEPRFSLPQRPVIVDSTLAGPDQAAQPGTSAKSKPAECSTRSLAPLPVVAPTPPPRQALAVSDFHLIPRTRAAWRRRQSKAHTPSTRATLIKLTLVALVFFGVLGATLATAGGGQVIRYLSNTLGIAAPYAPTPTPPAFITQRVQPITQWNPDAGYDTPQQHDTFWNSACSAAVMTELLRAWGYQQVTIGHIIDQLGPDITPWGGLMTQNAWDRIAQLYHLHAAVHLNKSLSYNEIVHLTMFQGIPVVLGLRDNGGRYFPAFAGGGHFLIAVGGSGSGLNIVDSSLYHIAFLSSDQINYLWTGETVVITPN